MLDVLPLSGSSKKQSDGNSSGVTTSGVDRAAVLASIMKWLSQLHPQLQVSVAGALLSDDILAQHMCSASVSEDLPQGASLSYVLSTLVSTLCSSHKSSIQVGHVMAYRIHFMLTAASLLHIFAPTAGRRRGRAVQVDSVFTHGMGP
jgi:hypothetical protein